jgi:hypothetical protein
LAQIEDRNMGCARIVDGQWVEIGPEGFTAIVTVEDGVNEPYEDLMQYPPNWVQAVAPEQRAALGIVEILEPEPAPAGVRVIGYVIEGEDLPRRKWLTEPIPLAELRAEALARLAMRRWERQQVMLWNGNPVPSDDATLGRILGAIKLAEFEGKVPDDVVAGWKFEPGYLTPVTLAQAIDYGVKIGAHIQACFNREAELAKIVIAPGASAAAILAASEAPWEADPA